MGKEFIEKVAKIQQQLKAPKNQLNKFGGYNYRNCEDILEAAKPLLGGMIITVSDEIVAAGDRVYVKATATISDGESSLSGTGYAREAQAKKGMDDSQITGSTSSYARKYALNGLLAIDDTKDSDHNSHGKEQQSASPAPQGFPLDDLAKQWIAAAKADPKVLDQLEDKPYRDFIASNLMN